MAYKYKIVTSDLGENILRSDGAWIPKDLGNVDYQEYLASLNETDKL
jgi:hypothetical protein